MPKSTKKPTREQLLQFVEQVARMSHEGEIVDGACFDPTYEDSVATVNGLICDARRLLGQKVETPSDDLVECPDEKICQVCLHGIPA